MSIDSSIEIIVEQLGKEMKKKKSESKQQWHVSAFVNIMFEFRDHVVDRRSCHLIHFDRYSLASFSIERRVWPLTRKVWTGSENELRTTMVNLYNRHCSISYISRYLIRSRCLLMENFMNDEILSFKHEKKWVFFLQMNMKCLNERMKGKITFCLLCLYNNQISDTVWIQIFYDQKNCQKRPK